MLASRLPTKLGAGGGTRTHTPSLAADFESATSTNSITPANSSAIIQDVSGKFKCLFTKGRVHSHILSGEGGGLGSAPVPEERGRRGRRPLFPQEPHQTAKPPRQFCGTISLLYSWRQTRKPETGLALAARTGGLPAVWKQTPDFVSGICDKPPPSLVYQVRALMNRG